MFLLWMDIGYCSLLMRDGFKRASGKPVHLEASTPRSRDIYAHLGFEVGQYFVPGENVTLTLVILPVNKEHRFGVGSVDEMGVRAKGAAAVGFPAFIMTKWETP
ncbi:hypothetical protein BJV78DRAFT_1173664 [Lactifluus subvellereus]|nr:hypothetical protein BJV78DRAFT_1173664 [Lactifluus subvellereus]